LTNFGALAGKVSTTAARVLNGFKMTDTKNSNGGIIKSGTTRNSP